MKRMILPISSLLTFLFCSTWLFAQVPRSQALISGPMVGYSAMREAAVWVQTQGAHTVRLKYWPKGSLDQAHYSVPVTTRHRDFFAAHLIADSVKPGTTYQYEIWTDDQPVTIDYTLEFESQPLWQHRTDPPAWSFATGSCAYFNETEYDRPGAPYGGDYNIFEQIHAKDPNMMMWLGDNIYLREVDWDSRTGILHRYQHMRSQPVLEKLNGSVHHYAIWDDHDYGPNDADRGYVHKDWTLEAFQLFWANPSYGIEGSPGITGRFAYYDADFFLLDNRWNRTPNERTTGERHILGIDQVEWLIDNLKFSRAPFKFVCVGGQVLNPVDRYENHARFREERDALIERIVDEEIPGVIFLTGDRHHTELSKLEKNGITLYDLTVSPLTSKAYPAEDEANSLRVEGTHVGERNFAILELSGPFKERVLTIRVYDRHGTELWSRTLQAKR